MVNLASLTSPEEEFFRQQFQQQQQPAPGAQTAPGGAGAGAGRRRWRRAPRSVRRQARRRPHFRYNELIGSQGGLTPLLFAARQGYTDTAKVLLDGGADVNQLSAGDKTSPLLIAVVNGHFDLSMLPARARRQPERRRRQRRRAALCVLNVQWAPKSLYPQPRAVPAAEDHVSGIDAGAARQGRRPERARQQQGLVLGLQLRSRRASTKSARRRSGAPPTPATSRR